MYLDLAYCTSSFYHLFLLMVLFHFSHCSFVSSSVVLSIFIYFIIIFIITADPCSPNPCLNFGVCQRDGLSNYRCQCRPGYSGQNCQSMFHLTFIFAKSSRPSSPPNPLRILFYLTYLSYNHVWFIYFCNVDVVIVLQSGPKVIDHSGVFISDYPQSPFLMLIHTILARIPLSGADLEGRTRHAPPLLSCRDRVPDFVWALQAKRMHQIMQTDF